MIAEMERIGRVLVEAGEQSCWHEWELKAHYSDMFPQNNYAYYECGKCKEVTDKSINNPDFSKPENILRLLTISNSMKEKNYRLSAVNLLMSASIALTTERTTIEKIPEYLAHRIVDIIEKEKRNHDANVLQMEAKFKETQSHRSINTPGGDHRDGKD